MTKVIFRIALLFITASIVFACTPDDTVTKEDAEKKLAEQDVSVSPEALQTYVMNSNAEIVGWLLIAGVNPNTVVLEAPPLIWAASLNQPEICRLLLEHGARVNARDSGVSALMVAAMEGFAEVVATLLEFRANVDLQNENGMTALMSAAYGGHHEIVRLLLRNGADANLEMINGYTAEMLAMEEGHDQVALLIREHDTAIF